jgi:diguanylate cyclase (GGDEF)-like protein/PAS domain S-box-containing protein
MYWNIMDINLNESFEKIISNLDLIPIPTISINAKSKLIMNVNKAYEGLIGINKKKIVGFPCRYSNFCFEEKECCPITDLGDSSENFNTYIINKDDLKVPVLRKISKIGFNGNNYYLETIIDLKKYIDKSLELERKILIINHNLEEKVKNSTDEFNQLNFKLKEELELYKKTKEDLLESQRMYETFYQNAPLGILTLSRTGIITSCNKLLYDSSGYTPENLVGKHFARNSAVLPRDIPRYLKLFSAVLRDKSIKPFVANLKTKDKKDFFVEVRLAKIKKAGKIVGFHLILRDVTESIIAERALSDSEKRFKLLSEATSEGIIIHDKGKILDGNERLAQMFGIPHIKENKMSVFKFLTKKSCVTVLRKIITNYSKPYQVEGIKKDGTKFPIEVSARSIPFEGKIVHVASIRDITAYKEAEKVIKESEQKFRDLAETLPEMVFESDTKGRMSYVNETGCILFGYNKKAINKGISLFEVTDKNDHIRLKNNMEVLFRNKKLGPQQYTAIKKSGQRIHVEVHSNININEKGELVGIRGILIDITERKKADEKIKLLSFHDYLTGIYNRAFFEEELHRLDTERQLPLTVVIGDVNGLKIINDAFGHEKGDELLIKIAKIFKESFRSEDIVARWGGDEFTVILPKINLKDTLKIISRINEKLKKESTKTLPLSVAFGLSTKEDSSQKIDELIKTAEDKMYRHKLIERQSAHSTIISSLEKALEERDYETEAHVKRIKNLAIKLGKELKLSEETLDELTLLAVLHDIGKISIADSIIFKPRSLTEEEWQVIKRHPEVGYRIATSSAELAPIAKGILCHHEWWNGKGYPKGLKGKNIPLISRIISIVDAYDAMTNNRPYRKALSTEKAIEELKRCAGTQFDPILVNKFIEII